MREPLRVARTSPSGKPTAGFWSVHGTTFFIGRISVKPLNAAEGLWVTVSNRRSWAIWSMQQSGNDYLRAYGLDGVFKTRRDALEHLSLSMAAAADGPEPSSSATAGATDLHAP